MSSNNNITSENNNVSNNNVGTTRSTGVMPVSIQGMLVEANSEMRDNDLFNMEISAEMMKDYSTAVVGVVQMGLDSAQQAAKATKWAGMSSAIGTGISGGIGFAATVGAGVSMNMASPADLDTKMKGNNELQKALNESAGEADIVGAGEVPRMDMDNDDLQAQLNGRVNNWKSGVDTGTFGSEDTKVTDDLAVKHLSNDTATRDTVLSKITENNKSLEMERENRSSSLNNKIRLIEGGSKAFGEIAQAGGKIGESNNQEMEQKAQANTAVIKEIDQQVYSSLSDAQSKMNQFLNDANQVAAQIYVQVHA